MHFTAGRGNGAQASIGGAIGLAGRAVRRLWALNSKGAFASALYRQAADYGPSIGFHSMAGRPDEPSSPSCTALCAISAKLGTCTFYDSGWRRSGADATSVAEERILDKTSLCSTPL